MEGGFVLYFTLGVGAAGVLGFLFNVYLKATRGVCTCKTDLTGKTVIITGPTAGIGVCTAFDMARRNARVILACRNLTKGSNLKRRVVTETGNNKIEVYELDVSSMESVRNFVTRFTQEESRCDVLINNAGVTGLISKKTTAEGLEFMYATNYFGPFLLTHLLLDTLKKSAPSRIVNVSSLAHIWGKIDLDNLNSERSYNMGTVYNGSKLALIMFTRLLSKRLSGTGVTANCLHPGTINTDLFMNMPGPLRILLHSMGYFFFKTPEEGAQTTIYCSVAPELEGVTGRYFSECSPIAESKKALDDDMAKRLWEKTEEITGLKK